jgi:hypothetical protein
MQLGHDTLIAAVLLISAGLTIAYAMVGSRGMADLGAHRRRRHDRHSPAPALRTRLKR